MEYYSKLLNEIYNDIRLSGWKKVGTSYYLNVGNNWGVLNFQKSNSSSSTETIFTINMGVSSATIRAYVMDNNIDKLPKIDECHWIKRVGFLLPEKKDFWWTIIDIVSFNNVLNEIRPIVLQNAIPEILKVISDQSLINLWMNDISPGITDFQRYEYLTILLKFTNSPEYDNVSMKFRQTYKGKVLESSVIQHINMLNNAH